MNRLIVYLLALGAFLVATAELVVAGVLQVIADDLHVSLALAGQLITAYSLAYAIGTPVAMTLASRSRRKSLLIVSLAFFVLGCIASYASSQYGIVLTSRLLLGVSAGVFIVTAMSAVPKLVPAERIGGAIGTIVLGFSSAMVLGVPLGVAIAGWAGWRTIFIVLGAASLLAMIGMIRLLPHLEGDATVPLRRQIAAVGNPAVIVGLIVSFFWNAGNSLLFSYLTPYLQQILHLQAGNIGLTMLVIGVFGVIGTRVGGYGVDKAGTSRMLAAGMAVCAIVLALLPALPASLDIAGFALIAAWMFALFVTAPAMQTFFLQQAPESANFVLSVNTSVTHLAVAAGAGVGGMVVNAASTVLYQPWLASIAYTLGLGTAIVSFALRRRRLARA